MPHHCVSPPALGALSPCSASSCRIPFASGSHGIFFEHNQECRTPNSRNCLPKSDESEKNQIGFDYWRHRRRARDKTLKAKKPDKPPQKYDHKKINHQVTLSDLECDPYLCRVAATCHGLRESATSDDLWTPHTLDTPFLAGWPQVPVISSASPNSAEVHVLPPSRDKAHPKVPPKALEFHYVGMGDGMGGGSHQSSKSAHPTRARALPIFQKKSLAWVEYKEKCSSKIRNRDPQALLCSIVVKECPSINGLYLHNSNQSSSIPSRSL